MTLPIVAGRLAEDGQTMVWPSFGDNGIQRDAVIATYHVLKTGFRQYKEAENLTYLILPPKATLHLDEREVPVPFKGRQGNVTDVRRLKLSPFSLTLGDGPAVVKIHPEYAFVVEGEDGTAYHKFEILETPKRYRSDNEVPFDFVYQDEGNGLAVIERGSRVLRFPGAVVFPDYCAFRLPGWIANEFNGSPEFRVAFSRFTEPRKGEVAHKHQQTMESYIVLEGEMPLFVETPDGEDRYTARYTKNRVTKETGYRGQIFRLKQGDVLLPPPLATHRIVDRDAAFPFTQTTVQYADGFDLTKIPASDRIVLEDV